MCLPKLASAFFVPSTLTLLRIALYTALIVLYGSPASSSPDPDTPIPTRHLFKRKLESTRIMADDASLQGKRVFGPDESKTPIKPRLDELCGGHALQTSLLKPSPDTSDEALKNKFKPSWKRNDLNDDEMLKELRTIGLSGHGQVEPLQFEARPSSQRATQHALELDERGKQRWKWIVRYAKQDTDILDEQHEGGWYRLNTGKKYKFGPLLRSSDHQIFRRNINYMLSRTWDSSDFDRPPNSPNWVINRYLKQWEQEKLDAQKMTKFGAALGINIDGVQPISSEKFDDLEWLRADYSSYQEWEKAKKKMILWYQNANMASLSSADQEILDFNLAYVNSRPWWGDKEMRFWRLSKMPYELLAKVGDLLQLGSEKVIERSDARAVRETILSELIDFASKVNIEEPLENWKWVRRGQISEQLSLTVTLGKVKKKIFKKNLKAVTLKGEDVWKRIRPETLDEGETEEVKGLIRFDLLLHGIHPSRARAFGKALSDDQSNSVLALIIGGEKARWAMRNFLPKGFGGILDRKTTYRALKDWFQSHLKTKFRIQIRFWKYFIALRLNRVWANLRRVGVPHGMHQS